MKQRNKYFSLGAMIFSVTAACILFFFFIFYISEIFGFIGKVIGIMAPVIIGGAIAYILNPIVTFLENWMMERLSRSKMKKKGKKKLSSGLAIGLSLIIFLAFVVAILMMIIPQVYKSLENISSNIDNYGASLGNYIGGYLVNMPDLKGDVDEFFSNFTQSLTRIIKNSLESGITGIASTIGNVTVNAFKVVINLVLGICVAVYLLVSKDRFIGQIKKFMYAVFKKETANVILSVSRQADSIFGGFISGKMLDSLIIGILCFIGCSIMRMPYIALISVVIGVTNIVPIFGPWAGAIPSILLILATEPDKAIIFAIFVIALQQFDGNILGPNIIGDSTGLNAFWVVVAITLGGGLFGLTGMVLGVPTFAVIYFLIKTIIEFKLKEQGMPLQTISYTKLKRIDPETMNAEFINSGISKRERRKKNIFHEDVEREVAIAARMARKNRLKKEAERLLKMADMEEVSAEAEGVENEGTDS